MKLKNQADTFKEFVLDQLRVFPQLICHAMFGGYGLYQDERFFGMIHKGKLYFKTDASTRVDYEAFGMLPFAPNKKQTLKNYVEVPVDILEDSTALKLWVKQAIEASL